MDKVLAVLGIIGGVIGVIGFMALALAYVRGAYNKATVDALRADIGDYKGREERHLKEISECKERITTLESEKNSRDREISTLKETVTQRAKVDKLEGAVNQMRALALAQHADLMAVVQHLLEAVEKIANAAEQGASK